MIRVNYRFRVLSPLVHFGEGKTSNIRLFRRQSVRVHPDMVVRHISQFKNEKARRTAVVRVLSGVYDSIPADRRGVTIWDEFAAKCHIAAVQSHSPQAWLHRICRAFDISSVSKPAIVEVLDRFGKDEFVQLMQDELQYLIAFLRVYRETKRNGSPGQVDLLDGPTEEPNMVFEKLHEDVPYIAGNHIRGKMRRLLMYDFCQQVGIEYDVFNQDADGNIRLPATTYSRLFTGGQLSQTDGFEDIGLREELIRMCPPLGLLGSAIGTMTIRGKLGVANAYLVCRENGTGDESYANFLDVEFGTRHDSAKLETDIGIAPDAVRYDKSGNAVKSAPTQMIYYHEVLKAGAEFDHSFVLRTNNSLLGACFARMLELFRGQPHLGGMLKTENGKIDLSLLQCDASSEQYLTYLAEHKNSIVSYFAASNNAIS